MLACEPPPKKMAVGVWPVIYQRSIPGGNEQINAVTESFHDSRTTLSFYSLDSEWTYEGEFDPGESEREFGWGDPLVVEMPMHEYVVMEVAKQGWVRTTNTLYVYDLIEVGAYILKSHEHYDCAVSDTQSVIAQDFQLGSAEIVAVDGTSIEELSTCRGLVKDVEPGEHSVRLEDTRSDRGGFDVRVFVPEGGAAFIPEVFTIDDSYWPKRSTSGGEP